MGSFGTEGRLPEPTALRSCGENHAWPRRGEERPGGAKLNPEGLEMDKDTPAGDQVRASRGEASRGRVCFVGAKWWIGRAALYLCSE